MPAAAGMAGAIAPSVTVQATATLGTEPCKRLATLLEVAPLPGLDLADEGPVPWQERLVLGVDLRERRIDILREDPGETADVAAKHLDVVARIDKIFEEQHTPAQAFPIPALDQK